MAEDVPKFGELYGTARDCGYSDSAKLVRKALAAIAEDNRSEEAEEAMAGCLYAISLLAMEFKNPNDPLIKEVLIAAQQFPDSPSVKSAVIDCHSDLHHFLGWNLQP